MVMLRLFIINRTVPNAYTIPSVYLARPQLVKTTIALGMVKK